MEVSAGTAFLEALADDVDRLLTAEPEVRADADDSVHQMRVATRRLRSVLRSYRMLLRRDRADAVTAELKWLAELLGVARDAEVRAERFDKLLAAHRDQLTAVAEIDTATGKPADSADDVPDRGHPGSSSDSGPAAPVAAVGAHHVSAPLASPADLERATTRLVTAERARYDGAHARILAALDSDRYRTLRDTLSDWKTDAPLRPSRAAVPAGEFFRVVLQRDHERVEAFIRAEPSAAEDDRIELLHDIRKSAKRLRYSCEAAAEILGPDAIDLGRRAKHLQTVLGDHRDAIESHAAIQTRATEAEAAGENPALYTILATAEAQSAHHELTRYPAAAEALTGQVTLLRS
ncbi:CHAD domain-containing protein [Nocardia sp. NPDC127579]|uniref:CHAD domain-containing protein n=1 Tax=Nocardia sp. NPDC127579 TaxID=3345402 RepID=UPI0036424EB1